MAAFKGSTFKDRAESAAASKKALLEAFKNKPSADDPAVRARMEERQAVLAARAAREIEKQRLKEEEEARRIAEAEARRIAEEEEAARKVAEAAARDEQIRAERKAYKEAKRAAREARNRR